MIADISVKMMKALPAPPVSERRRGSKRMPAQKQPEKVRIPDDPHDKDEMRRTHIWRSIDDERFRHENGWQSNKDNVLDRISALFNCTTMSDVTFHIGDCEIPAHKHVLAAASPVFYTRFFEHESSRAQQQLQQSVRARGTVFVRPKSQHGPTIIQVTGFHPSSFFEFLRYMYTDQCNITLENMRSLMNLAEDYKLVGLADRCLDFAEQHIVPDQVLNVLDALNTLLLKSVLCLWHDVVQRQGGEKRGLLGCRNVQSLQQRVQTLRHAGEQMAYKVGQVVMELETRCWRLISENTEKVLVSDAFNTQDIKIVRSILNLQYSNVPEISLFHALNGWAEHQCKLQDMEPTPENRRTVAGDTLLLIRFPSMTREQLQWEVVPTGLLPYRDIGPLLHRDNLQDRSAFQRFNTQAREGLDGKAFPQDQRCLIGPRLSDGHAYQIKAGDPIDAILSHQLLRQHLNKANSKVGAQLMLPDVRTSEFGVRKLSPGRLHSALMIDPSERKRPNSKHMRTEDFQRIGPGTYKFRENRIFKMGLEDGEVIVYDGGKAKPPGELPPLASGGGAYCPPSSAGWAFKDQHGRVRNGVPLSTLL